MSAINRGNTNPGSNEKNVGATSPLNVKFNVVCNGWADGTPPDPGDYYSRSGLRRLIVSSDNTKDDEVYQPSLFSLPPKVVATKGRHPGQALVLDEGKPPTRKGFKVPTLPNDPTDKGQREGKVKEKKIVGVDY